MTTATISKWGTGQGVHVSKGVMAEAQVSLGDSCVVRTSPGVIILDFSQTQHRKARPERVSFSDLFDGWTGSAEDSADPWGNLAPQGAEKELWS